MLFRSVFVAFFFLVIPMPDSEAMRAVWSLEQMIEKSDVIVVGTVESTWVDVRPFDEYLVVDTAKIRVDEWLKNKKDFETLNIRYYGYWAKTIDGLRGHHLSDTPVHIYAPGQNVLMIASYEKPTMVMGEGYYPFYEGKYVINGDAATSQAGEQVRLADLYGAVANSTNDEALEAQDKVLLPCTSDRTACFNLDASTCDPAGWECSNARSEEHTSELQSPI